MARLFKLSLEETNIVSGDVKPLTVDEDEQLTTAIVKDEQAIEEISSELDNALDARGTLVAQSVVNATVTTPRTEDVADSELAIESAIARIGISREELGLHVKSYTSLAVSNEGIMEFIKTVGKVIKDLIKKAVKFFKALWIKLKVKILNYKGKVEAMKKAMESITNSEKLRDATVLDKIASDLYDTNLASVVVYLEHLQTSPYLRSDIDSIVTNITNITLESGKIFKDMFKELAKNDNVVTQDIISKYLVDDKLPINSLGFAGFRIAKAAGGKFLVGSTDKLDNVAMEIQKFHNHVANGLCLGCDGNDVISLIVDKGERVISNNPKIKIEKHFTVLNKIRILAYNYNNIIAGFINNSSNILKGIDNASKIFTSIDKIQSELEKAIVELEKMAAQEVNNDPTKSLALAIDTYVKSIKKVAVDIPGVITKVYFSTIRDYLVIGNIILKHINAK